MDILTNFNGIEIIFILILILILFGPEQLPVIAARIGSYIRKLRNISAHILAEWRQEAGLDDLDQEGSAVTETLQETIQDVNREVRQVSSPYHRKPEIEGPHADAQPADRGSPQSTQARSKTERKEMLSRRLEELEGQLHQLRGELADIEESAIPGENDDRE